MHKRFLLAICILMVAVPALTTAQASTITPYFQQTVLLDDATPQALFTLEAEAGAVWSFSAVPTSGDIDPVLRLSDADGNTLLANDNASRRTLTARLENWEAPADGTYTLELSREPGSTSGTVILTAVPVADSMVFSTLPLIQPIPLAAGQALTLAEGIDPRKLPLTITFEATFADQSALGIELLGSTGNWMLVLGYDGYTLQRTLISEERVTVLWDVDVDLLDGRYTLVMDAESITVSDIGGEIFTLQADQLPVPDFVFLRQDVRSIRAAAMQANPDPVTIAAPFISAPYYGTDVTLDAALPPVDAEQRIYAETTTPILLVDELRQKGYIQTENAGSVAFIVDDGLIETSALGFSSYPLATAPFADFVLAFRSTLRQGDPSAACGMSFRQQDGATFVSVLYSGDGRAFILPYVDGELAADNLALETLWIDPGVGATNRVMLVAEGETASLFINGVYIGGTFIEVQAGGVAFETVIAEPIATRCTFSDIWLWSLD